MMIDLFYSVLQYIPDPIRREAVNIGIVVHAPAIEYSFFIETKNKRRIRSFDDEYDSEYMKMLMESIAFEFNFDSIDNYSSDGRFDHIHSKNYLSEKTKYYVNELRFLPVQKIETTTYELSNAINDLRRTYLYYDTPKGKRITKREVNALLNKRVKSLKLQEHVKKSSYKVTLFKDEPCFDFETTNSVIKTLTLDYSKKQSLDDEIKQTIFDFIALNDQIGDRDLKVIINNESKRDEQQKLHDILNRYLSSTVSIQTLSEYITQLETGKY